MTGDSDGDGEREVVVGVLVGLRLIWIELRGLLVGFQVLSSKGSTIVTWSDG